MKIKMQVALFAFLGSAIIVNGAHAQDAYLYVAHAAPGNAVTSMTPVVPIAGTNPQYPVDISVNSTCIATGIIYGEIRGPLAMPAGTYAIQLTAADSTNPCGGAAVLTASVPLAAGSTNIGVLTVKSGNVIGQIYTADLSPIAAGRARIEVINATSDSLTGMLMVNGNNTGPYPLPANSLQEFAAGPGLFTATILDSANNLLVGPVNVDVAQGGNSYIYVLGGSVATHSTQWIGPAAIRGIF